MKKLVLAPAVAVVAGALAFAGTPAFAAPTTECSNNTLNAKQGAQCTITLDDDEVKAASKVDITISNLPAGAKIKSVEAPNSADPSLTLYTRIDQLAEKPTFEVYGVEGENSGEELKSPNGDYTVTVTLEDGTKVNAGVIRYIDKDLAAAGDPELSTLFDKYVVSHFRAGGLTINYKNLEGRKEFTWVLKHEESGKTSTGTFQAEDVSKTGGYFYAKFDGAEKMSDAELFGKYTVTLKDESGKTLDTSVSFNVVDNHTDIDKPQPGTPKPEAPKPGEGDKPKEEAAKYALKVSPKEITPADFEENSKGVQLVVTGLKPNEKLTYSVSKQAGGGKVNNLFKDGQANKDGVWSHKVFAVDRGHGLDGFLGTYKVTVKSEEGVLTDTFTVTNTPGKKDDAKPGDKGDSKGDAKGGDNKNTGNSDAKNTGNDSGKSNNAKGNGKSSNALPRTGMELSGLVAGGVLLTVGAATVLVTRRRVK